MIIIFNLMGAVVGLLGLFLGLIVLVVTQKVTLGVLAVTGIWCWFGRAKVDPETDEKGPAPSVFFIPVFYWGIVAGLAVFPALFIDFAIAHHKAQPVVIEPGEAEFKRDEAGLRSDETDNEQLSDGVRQLLSAALPSQEINIRIKSTADSVLVLVKLEDLRKLKEGDRKAILESIKVLAEKQHPGVKVYAGLRGKLLYGAIAVPNGRTEVGTVVNEKALYAFYNPPAAAEKVTAEPQSGVSVSGETSESTTPSETPATSSEKTSEPETRTEPEVKAEPDAKPEPDAKAESSEAKPDAPWRHHWAGPALW